MTVEKKMGKRGSDLLFNIFGFGSFILILSVEIEAGGSQSTVSSVCFFLLFVYFLVFLWGRASKAQPLKVFAVRIAVLVGALLYYRFLTPEGILASHGVHFDPSSEAFRSPNLNNVKFWYEREGNTLSGPEIMGDRLYVDTAYRTHDGHLEVIVRSSYPDHGGDYLRIQIIDPPEGDRAFKVMPDSTMYEAVFYPPQGLKGAD
jgi:hypothetical protein